MVRINGNRRACAAPRTERRRLLAGCAAVALLGGVATAEEVRIEPLRLPEVRLETAAPAERLRAAGDESFLPRALSTGYPRRVQRGFYDTHLLPELAHQMNGFRSLHGLPGSAAEIEQSLIYSSVGDSARRKTIKGATNALKDYLLEVTELTTVIGSVPTPRFGGGEVAGDAARRQRAELGFSFGFAHRMPNLGVKYRIGSTLTRLGLTGHGAVDLRIEREDATRMRSSIGFNYDPRDNWYGMNYSVRF